MKRIWLTILVVALYALHQDVWLWRAARPLVFGFLPVGITYHVGYTLAIAALMWLLVKLAWPSHLEAGEERERRKDGENREPLSTAFISPSPSLSVPPSSSKKEPRQ